MRQKGPQSPATPTSARSETGGRRATRGGSRASHTRWREVPARKRGPEAGDAAGGAYLSPSSDLNSSSSSDVFRADAPGSSARLEDAPLTSRPKRTLPAFFASAH